MLVDPPEDSDEHRLLALAKYLGAMRDCMVTVSLLLQDALFELETERLALRGQHEDPLELNFVREHDLSPSKSSSNQAVEASGFGWPEGSSGPSKHRGSGAS